MGERVRVKICCISSVDEATLAIRHSADALGLVSHMPSEPGVIDDALIGEIAPRVPPPVASFLLTSRNDVDAIIDQQRRWRATTLQLVDALPAGSHAKLRKALPGIGLVQVVHVQGPEAIDDARTCAEHVDALLLDSGNADLAVKELGGTGRVHNWDISRQLVEAVSVPVFLAGGLVAQAIDHVRPFGVGLCSGVRTEESLDAPKLDAFMAAVAQAA